MATSFFLLAGLHPAATTLIIFYSKPFYISQFTHTVMQVERKTRYREQVNETNYKKQEFLHSAKLRSFIESGRHIC